MSEQTLTETITAEPGSAAGTGSNENQAQEASFLDSVPAEFKDEPCLKDIPNQATLVKNYIEAQKEIGRRVRIPSEQASDEAKQEFYEQLKKIPGVMHQPDLTDPEGMRDMMRQLGAKDDAEGYNLPEGSQFSSEQANYLKDLAVKASLTDAQFKELVNLQSEQLLGQAESVKKLEANTTSLLKEKWGSDFDVRAAGAQRALASLRNKYPDQVQHLIDIGAPRNAVFVEMLSELGKTLNEDAVVLGQQQKYGMTAEEAKQQIAEVFSNPNHAYHNPSASTVEHSKAKEYVDRLYEIASSKE